MVNEHDKQKQNIDDIEVTSESTVDSETELVDDELLSTDKIKALRTKLKECEDARRTALEDAQRAKADFLNARRRLEQEQQLALGRATVRFIESLLPVCDSFAMAMSDTEVWQRADERWRKGIEGIHNQLQSLLQSYNVRSVSPLGDTFDPLRHEALSEEPVTDSEQVGKIMRVIQAGYVMDEGDTEVLVRPARVVVGSVAT